MTNKDSIDFSITGIKNLIPTVLERKLNIFLDSRDSSDIKKLIELNSQILIDKGNIKFKANKERIKGKKLFIDLSQVTWVDLGAAAQLVLFVEWVIWNEMNIIIALPLRRFSKGEEQSLAKAKDNNTERYEANKALYNSLLQGRKNTYSYLEIIGFIASIHCDHVKNKGSVELNNNYDFHSKAKSSSEKDINSIKRETRKNQEKYRNPFDIGYKKIIPISWISYHIDDDLKYYLQKLILEIIGEGTDITGLAHIDAEAITNVILSELLKNVNEHAQTTHGLV